LKRGGESLGPQSAPLERVKRGGGKRRRKEREGKTHQRKG